MPREWGASSIRKRRFCIETPAVTGSSAFADDDTLRYHQPATLLGNLDFWMGHGFGGATHARRPGFFLQPIENSKVFEAVAGPGRARTAAGGSLREHRFCPGGRSYAQAEAA